MKIEIEVTEHVAGVKYFKVSDGNRSSDWLTFGDTIEIILALTTPNMSNRMSWMTPTNGDSAPNGATLCQPGATPQEPSMMPTQSPNGATLKTNDVPPVPFKPIVQPFVWTDLDQILYQKGRSYIVAPGWSIAYIAPGWKVYYNAIDAFLRLQIGSGSAKQEGYTFGEFLEAWQWVADLSAWHVEMITVKSVQGVESL